MRGTGRWTNLAVGACIAALALSGECAAATDFDRGLPEIEKPEFVGNATFSRDELLAESLFDFHSLARWRRNSPFRRNTFAKELRRIEEYYRSRGFGGVSARLDTLLQVGASPVAPLARGGGGGRVRPRVVIREGPRTHIREVRFLPQAVLSLDELRDRMPLREGDPFPFSPAIRGRATLELRLAFLSRGYLNVAVQDSFTVSEDSTTALLAYRMVPGLRFTVHGVAFTNNKRTRPELIRREMALEPGDTYSYPRVLESQQNLYNTGLFRAVSIRELKPDSAGATVDLAVRVDERKMFFIEPSAGIGQRDAPEARGSIGIGHRNLFGRGHAVELRTTFSKNPSKRNFVWENRLQYAQRHFLGTRVDVTPQASYVIDRRRDDIRLERTEFEAPGSLRLSRSMAVSGALTASRTTTQIIDGGLGSGSTFEADGDRTTRAVSMGITRTTPDNPFDPGHGSATSLSLQYAGFGGQTTFTRIAGAASKYLSRGSTVLAVSFRGGWVEPRGSDTNVGIRGVPLEYLFQAGGASTVRGYENFSLGAPVEARIRIVTAGSTATVDTTITRKAGTVVLLWNAELRRPAPWLPRRWNLRTAAFVDVGNVWASIDDVQRARFSPRFQMLEPEQTDLRYGVGFGLRWIQAFGPVRLDWGAPLKRRQKLNKGHWYFAVGHAF